MSRETTLRRILRQVFTSHTGFHWSRPSSWGHVIVWGIFSVAMLWALLIGLDRLSHALDSMASGIEGLGMVLLMMVSIGCFVLLYEVCRQSSIYLSRRRFNRIPQSWREKNAPPTGQPTQPGLDMHHMVSAYEKEMEGKARAHEQANHLEQQTPACPTRPSRRL